MAATLRAFAAGNVTQFTTATQSMSAAKPSGLATGDIWLIFHARRSTGAETAIPAGFTLLGSTLTGVNEVTRIYYRVADAADAAGGAKTWTQDSSQVSMTVSHAISGADSSTIFDAESPVGTLTASGTTHNISGLTPDHNGLVIVLKSNAQTATTYSPPTTQGGGWTEHHDTQQGTSNATRLTLALDYKTRLLSDGATGTITFTSSGTIQVAASVIHVNDPIVPTTVTGAAALVGSGVLSGSGTRVRSGAASLVGSGILSGSGTRIRSGTATLSGSGSLSGAGRRLGFGAATLSGAGTLASSGIRVCLGASAFSGVGALVADGNVVAGGGWGAPQNLIATAVSASEIDLVWDEVTGASGYDVERDGVVIAQDVPDTTYSDTGLGSSTIYTYRVRAVA